MNESERTAIGMRKMHTERGRELQAESSAKKEKEKEKKKEKQDRSCYVSNNGALWRPDSWAMSR